MKTIKNNNEKTLTVKKMISKFFLGAIITEFITQLFFLIISANYGEIVHSMTHGEGNELNKYIIQFISAAVLGGSIGIICEWTKNNIRKDLKLKLQFKNLAIGIILTMLILMLLMPRIVGKNFDDKFYGMFFIAIASSTLISYIIFLPIFNKIDKENIDVINKKIKEKN